MYYFQGLRALKCHWTKRSNCVNYWLKWPLQKTFLSSSQIPPGFPESLTPLLREFPESHQSEGVGGGGGVDFFGTTHSCKKVLKKTTYNTGMVFAWYYLVFSTAVKCVFAKLKLFKPLFSLLVIGSFMTSAERLPSKFHSWPQKKV